jgi:translation elongation factor EF-1beta
VKPYDAETNLDELAKKIIEIEMDGLFWKTEYKKLPIAYGVEKIVIGAVVEDEKVSTDDLQEKIEAMDDLVQSVDIAAFNKI